MGKYGILITLGIVVAILPFIGIPDAWKAWLYTTMGIAIVAVTYFMRRVHRSRTAHHRGTNTYQENTPTNNESVEDESLYARTHTKEETNEYDTDR